MAGPADAPTVLTGTFDGMLVPDAPIPNIPGTITIEPLTNSTVPEPSSFALMATGILGAITTLRYRRFITS
ncbi:PEP-CTERM sorting domain-containing protein [Tunturibacter empetritectus]|uniref:PEP-CTERM sorting domain-containing protein n=1 Tax=Tunturiibacter empetritectus TaxID=3069691 RepID=A0AAU7ZBJ0_9BACT